MRKRLAILLAVFALATAAFAMPTASAGGHLHGEVDIALYMYECPNPNAPGDGLITWAGTIDLGKKTLGIAFFETLATAPVGETGFFYFEENITLFRLPRHEWHPDAFLWAACTPWMTLMEIEEAGIGAPSGIWYGAGHVIYGKHYFEKFVGGNSFWQGTFAEDTTPELPKFVAELWVFPGNMD